MSREIARIAATPHIAGLPAGVPDSVADELTLNVAAEDRLATDALGRLGQRLPARSHAPLTQDFSAEIAGANLAQPRRPVHLPVGTQVELGPHPGDTWYVIGTSSDDVHLAQRSVGDTAARTTSRPWSKLVETNATLLDAPIIDATGTPWIPTATEGVQVLGRRAPVSLIDGNQAMLALALGTPPQGGVPTTWDDVLRATELTRRRPIAVAPRTSLDVAQLRDVLGDDHIVISNAGAPYGLRGAVVATETDPVRAAATLEDARSMQAWFHDKVGIDVWNSSHNAILFTDSPEHVANAAAAALGDDAIVFEGPRSSRVRGAWIEAMAGDEAHYMRRISKLLGEHDVAVRTHEAGHVATMREWGHHMVRLEGITDTRVPIEDSIVQEAFSDLLGAARTGTPSVGVRDLGRLANGWGSYDQLVKLIERTPVEQMDTHAGTQLLTKPMVRLLEQHGGDQLAEITGAAIRDIGRQIKGGSAVAVDLPMAARALRDATAWRHGAASAIVQHLDDSWKLLGLLR
jgi:hypothetical protein